MQKLEYDESLWQLIILPVQDAKYDPNSKEIV